MSGWSTHRPECIRQMHHTKALLDSFGAKTRFVDIGMQKMRDGSEIPLPPIILGELGNDPKKKTLLGLVQITNKSEIVFAKSVVHLSNGHFFQIPHGAVYRRRPSE